MTLTERQAFELEMEFLNADLGRLPAEMPVTSIKRELTRALYERPSASAQEVVSWVVTALDKVVTAWEQTRVIPAHIVDGVRTAATIITEAAERAGMAMPVQPAPQQPGAAAACAVCGGNRWVDDENWFPEHEGERARGRVPGAGRIPCGSCNEGGWDEDDGPQAPTADGQPPADWTPSDGGLTPSMFGGI